MTENTKTQPQTQTRNTINKDEKLRILAESLAPLLPPMLEESLFDLFLDRLKSEGVLKRKPVPEQKDDQTIAKHCLYMPELDYFIWEATCSDSFKHGGFGRGDSVFLAAHKQTTLHYPVGLSITGGNNDGRHRYIIPIATLKASINNVYNMAYTMDYRVSRESRSMYMKGIMDVARGNMPAGGNLRVRDIEFGMSKYDAWGLWREYMMLELEGEVSTREPIKEKVANKAAKFGMAKVFRDYEHWLSNHNAAKRLLGDRVVSFGKVLEDTRAYWSNYMPEDGGKSIVTKATMMEILDGLEDGTIIPGHIQWQIDITQSGAVNTLPYFEMDKVDWINPQKISIART